MKRLLSIMLTLCAIFSLLTVSAAAAATHKTPAAAKINPYTYGEVREYIQMSKSEVVLDIGGIPIHYYYGEGYTAYEKSGEYYLVIYNDEQSCFFINGYAVEAQRKQIEYTPNMDSNTMASNNLLGVNTDWTYMFTDNIVQISVGGLAVDAVMAMIPGGTFSKWALQEIASFLADKSVDLILPNNFAFTVRDDWYYANIDPWMGTVDYTHDYSAWWGYTRDPYMIHIVGSYYTGTIVPRSAA